MAEASNLSQTNNKRIRKATVKASTAMGTRKRTVKKLTPTSLVTTQVIPGTQDGDDVVPVITQNNEKEVDRQVPTNPSCDQHNARPGDLSLDSTDSSDNMDLQMEPPSWWAMGSPRLIATDTPEHVQTIVTKQFGPGVDMNKFLEPTRMVFDSFTPTQREEYKKKGLLMPKIPGSWKKWSAMANTQHIKFINGICALSQSHALCIHSSMVAAAAKICHDVEDIVASQNRTMHDYARTMHIMSCSDNLAAVTKAFGKYTRMELDEARSKLSADLEVTVSGWKQLTCVFNDPNVTPSDCTPVLVFHKLPPRCLLYIGHLPSCLRRRASSHRNLHFHL